MRRSYFWTILPAAGLLVACHNKPEEQQGGSPFDRFEKDFETSPKGFEPQVRSDVGQTFQPSGVDRAPRLNVGNQTRQVFMRCGAVRITCVVDGDTIWLDGVKIRIADIDTPEISNPKCAYEQALGEQATERLIQLLNSGPVRIVATSGQDEDRYGRKLRLLVREQRSLGEQLIEEGLARRWEGKRLPWC